MEQIRDGSAPRESGGHETTAEETAVTQGSATDEHKVFPSPASMSLLHPVASKVELFQI